MADVIQIQLPNPIGQEQLKKLRASAGPGPVLITTHDNPDPDALASGKGLATLLEAAWSIPSRLVYSGVVARAENRAVVSELTPEWKWIYQLRDLEKYSAVALVDTQPGAGNNSLPVDFNPHIVIDHHHPLRESLDRVSFVDVRPDVGATSSLVFQYLEAAGVQADSDLATALFYGLQTDTLGLARGSSAEDEVVYIKLLGLLDRRKLVKVTQAGLPRTYFRAFSNGLNATRIFGKAILADLGKMHRPDMTAEMADLLIRLEGTQAVLCMGSHNDTLYLSLRTELGKDAGEMVQKVIVSPGKAGGHGTMAGGQVPLDNQDVNSLTKEIEHRFLVMMGEPEDGGQPLLSGA